MKKIVFALIGLISLFSSFLVFSQTIDATTKSCWIPNFYNHQFYDIYCDGDKIVGVDPITGIFVSLDGGKNFTSMNNYSDNLGIGAWFDAVGVNDNLMFLSTDQGLLRSSDYGLNWSKVQSSNIDFRYIRKFTFVGDKIYTCPAFSGYCVSTDNGITWQPKREGIPYGNSRSYDKYGNHVMLSIDSEGMFYSSDDGNTWEKRNNGLTDLGRIESALAVNGVFYICSGNGVSKTTDYGLNWTQINEGLPTGASTIKYDGGYLFCYQYAEGIYRRALNGTSWELFCDMEGNNYQHGYLSSFLIKGNKIILSSILGNNFYSDDYGQTWNLPKFTQMTPPYQPQINCIAEFNNDLYAGTNNGLFISSDFGNYWTETNHGFGYNPIVYSMTSFDNKLYVATNRGIKTTSDKGINFVTIFNDGTRFLEIYDGILYSGPFLNGMFKSTDKGNTWIPINKGIETVDLFTFISDGNNFFTSTPESVYRSTDKGENWSKILELPGDLVHKFLYKNNVLYACTWYKIIKSTDNGLTWEKISDNGMSAFFEYKDLIYGFCNPLIYSKDYFQSWTLDNNGLPNYQGTAMYNKTSKLLLGTGGKGIFKKFDFTGDLGSIDVGKKSAPYPYLVSGYELNENITVTVPDGFEVSKSPFDGYGSSVTLTENEDLVIYNEVYIRFAPTKAKTYGPVNITHTSNGAATKYVSVTGIGVAVPPELTTTAATNISSSKANTGGNVTFDGGDDVTERGICWNKTGNPVITDNKIAGGEGTGEFISQLKGLKANTQYFVRAYATNSAATAYGNEINFNTGNPTLPELTTSDVMFVTKNSAQSGGEITDEGGTDITAKGVCWNKTGSPTILDNYTTETTEGNTFTSNLTNLEENTTYFVRAYSTNSKGTNYGNEIIFKTAAVGILLNQGWNMISSCVVPQSTGLTDIFSEIINKVVILKNQTGEVFIPQFSIDQITNWNQTQGYQIYMSSSATLYINGNYAVPQNTPIAVKNGWNLISYLRNTQMDAPTALASLTDNGNLVIAKDLAGNVYIPSFGINSLGDLKPGVGYRIYVTNNDTLVYPNN